MKKIVLYGLSSLMLLVSVQGCVSKRKKGEASAAGKFYHNTTSYYNGYWNAKELLRESMITLRAANVDNYAQILEVEDFVSQSNPKIVKAEMDKIIEKVTTVAQLHENSDWVDDCYVMMGRAQYLKGEYETAEETMEYFDEDFSPSNPYGRNFKSKKPTGKAAKRMKELAKKEKERERKEEAEKKLDVRKEKEKSNKEKAEDRKKAAKAKAKEREKARKDKAKGKKTTPKVEPPVTKPVTIDKPKVEPKKEEVAEEKAPLAPPKKQEELTAYSEGKLLLAQIYIKRENYSGAESILNRLAEITTNDAVKRDLPATFASLYIKKEQWDKALVKLEEAIENADSRQLKSRYAFIAGQIYQNQKNYAQAYSYFDKAKDWSRDIKMEFVADLSSFKNGILSGQTPPAKAIEQLNSRLKEVKYEPYKDQIYFTLGEIHLNNNNEPEALKAFSQAAANSSNSQVKADAYYAVADLYYNKEDYYKSWLYFDSTSTVMPKADTRFEKVQKYAYNLKDIANHINIIKSQDTLLQIVALTGDDQKKALLAYFEKNGKKIAPQTENLTKSQIFRTTDKADRSVSSFFAYNEATKKKGREEFFKIWNNRPLEDDWRRINKSSSSFTADESNASTNDKTETTASKEDAIENSSEYKEFLKSIPNNPIKKQEALDKIMNSHFALGKLFRDKLEKYAKSAQTLETMHERFGATPHELESSYYLYLDYLALNESAKMAKYKNLIISKYADSKYASLLNDPETFNKSAVANKPETYYDGVYDLFKKGKYQDAISAIDRSNTVLQENNPYPAKFALLRAMCLGSTQGKDAYIQGLMALVSTYPNTAEELKAKEILRFLGGDKGAFSSIGVQDVDKIYEKDMDEKHYIAIVTYQMEETTMVNMKIAISEYNKANFKNERLQLGDAVLDIQNNSQIILVRTFENGTKAMDCYKKIITDQVAYFGSEGVTADILPISARNYRKMLSERNANGYRIFFEENYLKNK